MLYSFRWRRLDSNFSLIERFLSRNQEKNKKCPKWAKLSYIIYPHFIVVIKTNQQVYGTILGRIQENSICLISYVVWNSSVYEPDLSSCEPGFLFFHHCDTDFPYGVYRTHRKLILIDNAYYGGWLDWSVFRQNHTEKYHQCTNKFI